MGLKEDIGTIKGVSDGLTENKVSQFAYDSTAYDNNLVEGEDTYNINDHNCIPKSTLSILKINATVRDKGWRARASSLTRMLINHMLGRTSYNLNKVNDLFNTLLLKLYNFIGSANGLATLDADGRIPYSQLPESAVELKGYWDASTNTPALVDGTGDTGDEYYVSVAGTQNLGSGSQYFNVGDRVLYLDGVWRNINATAVKKVNNVVPDAQGNVPVNGAISSVFSDDLTVNKALASDANGKIVAGGATATELGYLSGATSNIQEQLNGKSSIPTNHASPDSTYGLSSDVNYGHCKVKGSFASHTTIEQLNNPSFTLEASSAWFDTYTVRWGDALTEKPNTLTFNFALNSQQVSPRRVARIRSRYSFNGVGYTDWVSSNYTTALLPDNQIPSLTIDLTEAQAQAVVRYVEVELVLETPPSNYASL